MPNNLKTWANLRVGDLPDRIKSTRKEINNNLNMEDDSFDSEKARNL